MNKNLSAIIFLISLFIGQANAQCAQGTSPSSSDSTCIQGTTGIATIASPSSSATAIMPFVPRANMSCTTPWGATVPEMGTVIAYQSPTGTFDPVLQDNSCVYEERTCISAVLSGTYQYEDCNSGPLNGACGAANGQTYYAPNAPAPQDLCNPTTNLDPNDPTESTFIYSSSSGNSIPPLTGSTFNWTCSGQNGGTTASCSANFVNTCSGPVTTNWTVGAAQCQGTYNGTITSGTTVPVNATPTATYTGTGTGSLLCSNGTWTGGAGAITCNVPTLLTWKYVSNHPISYFWRDAGGGALVPGESGTFNNYSIGLQVPAISYQTSIPNLTCTTLNSYLALRLSCSSTGFATFACNHNLYQCKY